MSSPLLSLVVRDATQDAHQALIERYGGRLFLTVAEVGRLTDTDPRTVRRGIDADQIPAVHIGATIRVPAAPFWQMCGLDPQTLRPPTTGFEPGPDAESEAGPDQGPDLVDIAALDTGARRAHHPPNDHSPPSTANAHTP